MRCQVVHVSATGYHAHLARRPAKRSAVTRTDEALLVETDALRAGARGAYDGQSSWHVASDAWLAVSGLGGPPVQPRRSGQAAAGAI